MTRPIAAHWLLPRKPTSPATHVGVRCRAVTLPILLELGEFTPISYRLIHGPFFPRVRAAVRAVFCTVAFLDAGLLLRFAA